MDNKRVATLTLDDGRSVELPILSGTLGSDVLDIHNLSKLGLFTYDPAFFPRPVALRRSPLLTAMPDCFTTGVTRSSNWPSSPIFSKYLTYY